jgi:uncharacterized membrane protein
MLRSSLWFLPTMFAIGAVALWLGMRAIDDADLVSDLPLGFGGGPEGAREVLSAIATSMIAFTGVVFSVTIVALQLAGSQYSPRVLRNFLRERRTQAALGSFIATFVYALLVLRGVRSAGPDSESDVPRFSVSMAFVVLAISLILFVVYVNQIAQSIRASRIVARIGDETRGALEHVFANGDQEPEDVVMRVHSTKRTQTVLAADGPGIVEGFDVASLVDLATEQDVCVEACVMVGDFVATGVPVLRSEPTADLADSDRLRRGVVVGLERTMDQDVRFGFRQLVDVALRALSPGMNDPTTAVQALDQLHDLLRRSVRCPFRSGLHADDAGTVRFVEPLPSWSELLQLAVTEIREASDGQVQVTGRLQDMLDDLADIAPLERRPAIARQRAAIGRGRGRPVVVSMS